MHGVNGCEQVGLQDLACRFAAFDDLVGTTAVEDASVDDKQIDRVVAIETV